jgi:hypothetical protein
VTCRFRPHKHSKQFQKTSADRLARGSMSLLSVGKNGSTVSRPFAIQFGGCLAA